jgi:outer membrane protein insertion porin family
LLRSRAALFTSACLIPTLIAIPARTQPAPPGATGAPGRGTLPGPAAPEGTTAPAPPAPVPAPAAPAGPVAARPPAGGRIAGIRVEGNQRIENGTILSYMLVQPGDAFDPDRIDRSLKTLYGTGLFSDVQLTRQGDTLVVHVKENPLVNRVAFEGNRAFNDAQLRDVVDLRPRSVFTPGAAQADRQRILDAYAKKGRYDARVEPKIIDLGQNRVDVVFEINDGDSAYISRIHFVGNHAFSESRLREVISSREEAFWRFLSSSDSYDPARIDFDKELLRRYYLKSGYVDFKVVDATAELSPDKKAFFVTFALDEGERYRVSKVTVNSTLRNVPSEQLQQYVDVDPGDWYDGDAVERSVQAMTDAVQNRGQAFVQVNPRISRDEKNHTVELVFDVAEGPRVYVERIDITGNVRTQDKVIRREFRLAEGDAYNAALVRRSRQRLQDLNYFNSVNIAQSPGSAPDKTILTTQIEEKATGEFTVGGGYSTDAGPLLSVGLRERNFVGTGIDAGVSGVLATKETQINLSVTDPYFLDRNIVAGFDLFQTRNNNQDIASYSERRTGGVVRMGYDFSEHLRQAWSYSLVDRDVYNVATNASIYIQQQAGQTVLSQIGQTLALDYRDSTTDPRDGFIIRLGTDFAGLGGTAHFVRTKVDGEYFYPLEKYLGDPDYGIVLSAGTGYLFNEGRNEQIIDNFFLGGENLRGFASGGAGPHTIPTAQAPTSDSVGGRFIWTQSTEFHFPLPISADIGITGRAFVDVGALSQMYTLTVNGSTIPITDSPAARVGAGLGISWRTPFGLINLDLADPVVKKKFDKTQIFRFGFGTRF